MTDPTAFGHTLASLVSAIGGTFRGDSAVRIAALASAHRAGAGTLTFAVDARRAKEAATSDAAAVILREADAALCEAKPRWIHPNPYFAYAKVAQRLSPRAVATPGIHPTAWVDPAATVDLSAEIGPFVFIAPHARIGARARLHAGVRIGRGSEIGEATELFPNVVFYPACFIGARGIVHAGAVIGADGFGFAPHDGTWEKIPQTGRVMIGDDVEVGANTTIDRGALEDTILGNGVKLDNQVQIAHNCVIGDHTVVAGCAGIAGSTIIGKNCMIAGAAMLLGHLSIPDGTVISAGSLVSDNITKPGRYTGVFPTVEHRAWQKMAVRVRKLSRD